MHVDVYICVSCESAICPIPPCSQYPPHLRYTPQPQQQVPTTVVSVPAWHIIAWHIITLGVGVGFGVGFGVGGGARAAGNQGSVRRTDPPTQTGLDSPSLKL